jgi:outer membrane protein
MRSSLIAATLVLAAATSARAQTAPAPGLKVGYIELARALNEVEEGKAAKAKLKADFEAKQKQLDKLQIDLKAKKEDFDKKAAMMNPEVREQKAAELQKGIMELQKTYTDMQRELSEREAAVANEIGEKLKRVVNVIGDRDGYFMILNIADNVMYYKRHLDITDEVVREYNRQFPKTGK